MKELRNKIAYKRLKLILICSVSFLIIFSLAATILVAGGCWFYRNNLNSLSYPPDNIYPLITVVLSLIIGSLISLYLIKVVFIPLRKLRNAILEISNGNYSVRVSPEGINALKMISDLFNQMAEDLQKIENTKNEFISNFSHEFKTPVSSIAGFAEMLKENLSEAEKREYTDIIVKESRRLAQLSGDILELSRLDNKQEVPEKAFFNLSEQIRLVVVSLDTKWTDKNITFNLECDEITFFGNAKFLQLLWVNVIDNAIKFSPDGSTVYITLKEGNGTVTVSVKDRGCGMDEKTRMHAFERLYRGNANQSVSGSGIGLAIAKRVTELHKGKIEIKETGADGTTIEVEFNIE